VEPTNVPDTPIPTEEPEPAPIVVIDDLGSEIVLEEPAQIIVSISPNLTAPETDWLGGILIPNFLKERWRLQI
jgi:ABC-type Fe3+-hydroxamate transport system substrate-binding protein